MKKLFIIKKKVSLMTAISLDNLTKGNKTCYNFAVQTDGGQVNVKMHGVFQYNKTFVIYEGSLVFFWPCIMFFFFLLFLHHLQGKCKQFQCPISGEHLSSLPRNTSLLYLHDLTANHTDIQTEISIIIMNCNKHNFKQIRKLSIESILS